MMTKQSFLYQHCLRGLTADPTWSLRMYVVFNDLDDDTEAELNQLLPRHLKRGFDGR